MPSRVLLAAADQSGSFPTTEYDMTDDEVIFWQDQAALLDPLAYEWVVGASQTRTVTSGKHWYVVQAWWVDASSGDWFHRQADVNNALQVPSGRVLTCDSSHTYANMYLCKPELVVGVDARYGTDPRGLYFERLARLGSLTQYTIGGARTNSAIGVHSFPGDFTYGLVVHSSVMHVAWTGLMDSGETYVLNLLNELSNTDGVAFSERVVMPFTRATFPKFAIQGVSDSEGNGVVTYVKLPVDW